MYRKDGSSIWTDVVLSLVRDADGTPRFAVGMVEDITERQRLQDRLRHQAHHDPLTGLPNRTLFFERLDAVLAEPDREVGVCYLDLDGFKAVNDTLGHDIGDELLQAVADRLADRGRAGTWWPGWAATSSSCSSSTPARAHSGPSWCAARRRRCPPCAGRSRSPTTASWSRPAPAWCSARTSAPGRPS